MSKRTPEGQPEPSHPDVNPEARQAQEDFYASSKETQKELKARDEAEAWDLYEHAHEITRENALADVRSRLHRMKQRGIEVTPEMEERELENAQLTEEGANPTIRTRRKKGRAQKGDAKTHIDNATTEALHEAVREQERIDEAEKATPRTQRKIELAHSREDVEVRALAEELRREDAVANVENHIRNTREQGARWWPWEKTLARRRALRELKDQELSDDWLAYAEQQYHKRQDEYIKNGQSLSETRRALADSADRIKGTWKKGGWRRFVTIPARLIAEGGRLAWYGAKRGRKEARVRQLRSEQNEAKRPAEPERPETSDEEGS